MGNYTGSSLGWKMGHYMGNSVFGVGVRVCLAYGVGRKMDTTGKRVCLEYGLGWK